MRMWGAGFGFAAMRAVTRDKKPVSIPFVSIPEVERDTFSAAPISRRMFGRDRFAAS